MFSLLLCCIMIFDDLLILLDTFIAPLLCYAFDLRIERNILVMFLGLCGITIYKRLNELLRKILFETHNHSVDKRIEFWNLLVEHLLCHLFTLRIWSSSRLLSWLYLRIMRVLIFWLRLTWMILLLLLGIMLVKLLLRGYFCLLTLLLSMLALLVGVRCFFLHLLVWLVMRIIIHLFRRFLILSHMVDLYYILYCESLLVLSSVNLRHFCYRQEIRAGEHVIKNRGILKLNLSEVVLTQQLLLLWIFQ